MSGVGLNFSPIDFIVNSLDAGTQLLTKAFSCSSSSSRVNRLFFAALGLGYLVAGTVSAAVAFPVSSRKDCENGDFWNGYCYPYKDFPHGHFDAKHGSITFEAERSQNNENSRRREFFTSPEFCLRGEGVIHKVDGSTHFVCWPNGTLTNTTYDGASSEHKDIL